MDVIKHGPGRPPKFGRPSRAVTVTLPEDVIARLGRVDADLGRAIVSLVDRATTPARPHVIRPAELASYGRHAVIVVTPVRALKRLAGVQLVPLGSGRSLISLDGPHAVPQLELDILDALADERLDTVDRQTLDALAGILREARLTPGVSIEERTIIVLESKRQRRAQPAPGRRASAAAPRRAAPGTRDTAHAASTGRTRSRRRRSG